MHSVGIMVNKINDIYAALLVLNFVMFTVCPDLRATCDVLFSDFYLVGSDMRTETYIQLSVLL